VIELSRRHLHRSFNLISIGKTLAREGIAAEQAPPAFLQIEPARALGNEDVLEAWVVCQPGTGCQAIVTAQVVGDDEDVARRIIGFDLFEQLNVVLGIARSRAPRDLFAIADTQRSIDPDLLLTTTVFQRGFDAMAVGRPARRRSEGARNYRSEFVGADGRRSRWWLGVMGDDRGPFGTKSLSSLVPQLCVRRQRAPSRK
jgi:hypothetical protein